MRQQKHSIQSLNDYTKTHFLKKNLINTCLMCRREYNISNITLEQQLINDHDFCQSCWDNIMTVTE